MARSLFSVVIRLGWALALVAALQATGYAASLTF